jgi:hypothetical protein
VPRYFIDTRDDDVFLKDDVGIELFDLEAAKALAAASLAELGRDVLPSSKRRVIVVLVREEQRPLLELRLTFEAIDLVAS